MRTKNGIKCKDCVHFRANPKSPQYGLGSCTLKGKENPDRGMWARAVHRCEKFEKIK